MSGTEVGGLAIRGPWRPLTAREAARVPAAVGVYEVRDADGETCSIGYAGARTRFGLRGVLIELAEQHVGREVRTEVTTAYLSRWRELHGRHLARTGRPVPSDGPLPHVRPIGRRRTEAP